jgi:hypothetical protein
MSDPDHFLARWSRRKRQGGDPAAPKRPQGGAAEPPAAQQRADAPDDLRGASPTAPDAPPTFDPATLPSLESITAMTDVRPFLGDGIPAALTRAALRRAWSTDPTIRDFVEMAENQWDFNAPDGIPGFASFQPEDDLRRFVGKLLEDEQASSAAPADTADSPTRMKPQAVAAADPSAALPPSEPPPEAVDSPEPPAPPPDRRTEARASESLTAEPPAARPTRRGHGGALPQ